MDVGLLSMTLSQSKTLGQAGTLILAKTIDSADQMAAGEIAMINSAPASHALETAVNPAVGSNIDVYA